MRSIPIADHGQRFPNCVTSCSVPRETGQVLNPTGLSFLMLLQSIQCLSDRGGHALEVCNNPAFLTQQAAANDLALTNQIKFRNLPAFRTQDLAEPQTADAEERFTPKTFSTPFSFQQTRNFNRVGFEPLGLYRCVYKSQQIVSLSVKSDTRQ